MISPGQVLEDMRKTTAAIAVTIPLLLGGCNVLGPAGCDADLRWRVTPTEANLRVGESITADAEASGCGGTKPLEVDMRWSSEDPAVAGVNEMTGRITAEAAGSTIIMGEDLGRYGIGPVEVPVTVEP